MREFTCIRQIEFDIQFLSVLFLFSRMLLLYSEAVAISFPNIFMAKIWEWFYFSHFIFPGGRGPSLSKYFQSILSSDLFLFSTRN